MKKRFLLIAALTWMGTSLCQSQVYKNWWYFGANGGCNFTSGSPVPSAGGVSNTEEGTAVMSHPTTGALLFYTDGLTVWNATHAVMTNGSGLLGNSTSTQSALILPRPGSTTQYYIFTTFPGNGLRYSVVDMTLSGGLGAVTAIKNVLLGGTNVDEKLAGCLHSNGTDYWVTVHLTSSNTFVTYPLTATGMGAGIVSNVGPVLTGDIGYMNFSNCADKIGLSNYNPAMGVASFNNLTGVVSNWIDLSFGSNYSSGFSPDGTKFYHWSWTPTNAIYEVDLNAGGAAAINASRVQLATSASWYGAFVIGRDGKIYIPAYTTSTLCVINNPNLMGGAAGFAANAIPITGTCRLGLPNFAYLPPCTPPILPIELLSFEANCNDKGTELIWKTTSESDSYFMIEKSSDGYSWREIGVLNGTDHSTDYSYQDSETGSALKYYRLKQPTSSGEFKYSDITNVDCISGNNAISFYPNPATSEITIPMTFSGNVTIEIYNPLGQLVLKKEVADVQENAAPVTLNIESLPQGSYMVKISDGRSSSIGELIK